MKNSKGFTLIELMIVIAIIAIIASIAIPNLLSARLSANETAAIATLRNIVSSQAQVQSQGAIDCDVDGIGEHGWFAELAGSHNLRDATGPVGGPVLNPPVLSGSLATVVGGFVNKSGYLYEMCLPGAGGAALNEAAAGGSPGGENADLCETCYIAYAWPMGFANTGNRAFVVNQTGDVLQTNNLAAPVAGGHYSAAALAPAGDAAMENGVAGTITGGLSISNRPNPAVDTNVWLVVN